MQIDLTDAVALVTGSAHRVGKAIALELAKNGVHIMVHYNSTNESTVRETMQEIKSYGVDAFPIQADIGTPEGVQATFAALKERFDKLDILVNSASTFTGNTLLDVTLEDWYLSLNVNLTAPLLCTQAAARIMQENGGGSIVNICDYGSIRPWPERVDHGISKAGLWMLTQVSAISLGQYNIRVNAVIPGPVLKAPEMTDKHWEDAGKRSPLGRTGDAEDVARAVAYLVKENYITGTAIHVNAGEHL